MTTKHSVLDFLITKIATKSSAATTSSNQIPTTPSQTEGNLDMTCAQCGAPLTLDLDNLQRFCPYCGNRILVDPVAFKEVLVQREITKRDQMKYEQERYERASHTQILKIKIIVSLALTFLGILTLVGGWFLADASGNPDSPWYILCFSGLFLLFGAFFIWLQGESDDDH